MVPDDLMLGKRMVPEVGEGDSKNDTYQVKQDKVGLKKADLVPEVREALEMTCESSIFGQLSVLKLGGIP